jgi:PGM1 C-terminal domain
VATDHLESPDLRALSEGALLDLAARRPELAFDRARRCGVVLHMISALALGRLGVTVIGTSAADAQDRYERALGAVLEAAAASATPAAA